MKRNPILTVFWIIAICLSASATIINIPDDYATIQQGIYAAGYWSGDTVLVQPGLYVENIYINNFNVTLGSLYLLTGDTTFISSTIIDANLSGTVVTFGIGSIGIIVGFTIQNGAETIGGIGCLDANPMISNNVIRNNSGTWVGGIYCGNGNPTIQNNIIRGNSAEYGGGIFCQFYSDPIISNNLICENFAYGGGGGIYCEYYSDATIINNTVTNNSAYGYGGGIYSEDSSPIITNNVFWADTAGSEVYFSGGLPIITYCDIWGGWEGEGNIDVDPLFRDPESGDYHLMSTACGDLYDSPCIDVGHPGIIDSLLDCSWGLGTILSDMGAYGGGDTATVGIFDHQPEFPYRFALLQNYPNPFNAATVIRYALPEPADVIMEIFDILGRRVEAVVSGKQPAGSHSVIWDAKDLPSGIYLYRIQAGDYSQTRKMVFLK
jgi:predicted outer membrane repeat protein